MPYWLEKTIPQQQVVHLGFYYMEIESMESDLQCCHDTKKLQRLWLQR
jgi:hypothetical protein